MPQFNWDPRYSVGIRRFDDDHQELFRILNTLHDAMMTGRSRQVLQQVLSELLKYTEDHFSREEETLRQAAYPRLQAHIEQHRRFTTRIGEISEEYRSGDLAI